ncbi:MAG: alpha/beta hydrolase [Pseudomonadales bacterium]|nr:alpha/beta hydrolase [Pseudomonadales bacterium]
MKKIMLLVGCLLTLAIGGFVYVNHATNGIVGFYAWKALTGSGKAQHTKLNGIDLYFETYGENNHAGTQVLVMHGGTAFLETMHHQIRALAKTHRVIAPDSRAHGRSTDAPDVPISYTQMADDMVDLLDYLDIKQVDIFGWSDGGNIGIDMAIRYPDRVNRLVTFGSNFHHNGLIPTAPDDTSTTSADHPAWESVRSFYQSVASNPEYWPVFHGKLMTMWAEMPTLTEKHLAQIQAPTLVMAGEFDGIREDHTRALAAAIANHRLIIVTGEDHFAPLMAPETVTPHVVKFLQ